MDYSLKDVARRIKELREATGYTQHELAKLTGVTTEDYKVLEKGETDFSFTFIYKCAKAWCRSMADIRRPRLQKGLHCEAVSISPYHPTLF